VCFGLLGVSAVYTINMDDVRAVAPGCSEDMLETAQKLDVEVRTLYYLLKCFVRFATIPACDRQTHRHTTTAITRASIASCG